VATSTSSAYSAICTENITYEGSAHVLMANFRNSNAGGTVTEVVYASDSSTVAASLTPDRSYKSIAFTVSGEDTYNLKTNGVTQQYYDNNVGADITEFTVSRTGLNIFDNVQDAAGGGGDTTAPALSAVSPVNTEVGNAVYATSSENGILYLVPKGTYANKAALDAVTANKATASCTANTSTPLNTTGLTAGTYQVYAVDAANNVSSASADITLTAGTDGLATSGGNTSYIAAGSSVVIDGGLTLTAITGSIDGASVMIRNFSAGDVLTYPAQIGNITGSYNSTAGVLTLTGSDTQDNYQAALRSVRFSTSSDVLTSRNIDFSVG